MNVPVTKSLESLAKIAARLPAPVKQDKFTSRRLELAEGALETLATLGYANTSLREIAQNTAFSHGVLHYYFTDKVDLIACCVTHYKNICVTRYDDIILTAETQQELLERFLDRLGSSLSDEAPLHRLWYDLRNQSLFEKSFQEDVAAIDKSIEMMIWRICSQYCSLGGGVSAFDSRTIYAIFDGVFQNALHRYIAGDETAVSSLQQDVQAVLSRVMMNA